MLKKISLLLFLLAAAAMLQAAPIPLADCNFGVSPVAGATAVGNMPISYNANNKEVIISYEPHRNKSASGGLSIPLKRVRGIALVVAECNIIVGNTSLKGNGQVSGNLLFDVYSSRGKATAGFTLGSKRYNRDRKVTFIADGKAKVTPVNFMVDKLLQLQIKIDMLKRTWVGAVYDSGKEIFTTGEQSLKAGFTPSALRVVAATVSANDGMKITVSQPSVLAYTAADAKEFLAKKKSEYCSTLPRQYKHVNRNFYNSSFGNFAGNNNIDRVGAADKATAEKRAKELADLGFTAVLYNGRHFRANYLEEFPHIEEAGRIIREACAKYNIKVIEHHDPTIMAYRGYPFMLDKLDWLQQDIRSGESNYWFCPGNDDFMSYLVGYLVRLQQKAQFDGFMIDELNLASRRDCGCEACKKAYIKETSQRVPRKLDFKNPALDQRQYRSWGIRMTNLCNNTLLNKLQQVKKDTVIMTYCSNYFDPNSQTIDLDEAAALYSPFVGWENMVYNPVESHTSLIGNLKTRNAYGDFYNIPVWSLNREAVAPQAHYVMWAMCQATRHSIWHGARLLATPEHVESFKKYSKWQGIMPHEFARTFTDTALLVSGQTWRTSSNRNFFWCDFRGVMDTFVRSSRQFDTILDGDLFYPDRLGKYKVIVLASQSSLSATQCRTLEKFAAQGGTVILTGNSSLYDERGNRRVDFMLSQAMNITYLGKTFGKGTATSKVPGSVKSFAVPHVFAVKILQPGKSEVLAEYSNGKNKYPLVVKTPFGKGAFIYVAGQYGKLLYEQEIRHNHRTPYNYRPQPELASLLNGIYDYAHKTAQTVAPTTIVLPDKVLAIANQQQRGSSKGDIFVQIMNYTGSRAKAGMVLGNSVPETVDFPPVKGELKIMINRPCQSEAVLESPERPTVKIQGIKQGKSTLFTIPGKELGFFAQLRVKAQADKNMRIIEPPMSEPAGVRNIAPAPLPDFEKLYHPARLKGEISSQPAAELNSKKGFAILPDGTVKLDDKVIIAGDEFRQSSHEWQDFTSKEKLNVRTLKYWQDKTSNASGILASGKSSQDKVAFVRETTRLDEKTLEINFAGAVKLIDHGVLNNSYTLKIPVETLRGASARYYLGMHRSGRAPRSFKLTGNEPDGKISDSIRSIQFTGGAVDFSIDFSPMGVWGLFVEDLSTQYKAHLLKEGSYYYFVIPCNDSRFGTKYFMKTVLRSGKTDFSKLHVQNFNQYQYGRAVDMRLQFTDGVPAGGFAINKNIKGFNLEFSRANMQNWSDRAAVKLQKHGDHRLDPLHYSAACGKGKNSYTFEHENGLALVNVMLNAQAETIKGSVRTNQGKAISFNVNKGNFHTVLLPVMIKNNKVILEFDGNWAISGIVMQPLMTPDEDYLFSRTYFNCGKVPWLLKELQCDPADWKYFSDIHLRKARWMY